MIELLQLAIACCIATAPAAQPSSVPASRLERLSRGANITQWFQVYSPKPESHYKSYMSDEELALIRKLGLRHVRLCVSPQYLYDPADPEHPVADHLSMLEEAIVRIHKQGLAVILDPHNGNQRRIEDDIQWSSGFVTFWGALASKMKRIDPEMLFFEVVNEPVFNRRETEWFALQERIVDAIRRGAPNHTIIATGANWSGVDGLTKLTPLADKNVVYSFHFYDPFTFTHQGATWSGRVPPLLREIPYPSSPEAVADALSRITDSEARGWVEDYGKKRWDRDRLKRRLGEALDWGRQHGVPVYCGEFGVYPRNAPPDSRRNWFRDFASVLKESGVGWAVWGWDDGFGFARRLVNGSPVIDQVPVQALGLNPP